LCEPGIIEKKRHLVKAGSHIIEVDQFFGENEGLVMAEIELKDENEPFDKPAWLGQEVTGDARYYNAMLSKLPFTKWQNKQN
ncbi:MAG: adenylate cyclase, partial [Bacteroidales bacterium]|nr:adenylate cyclase [Bacteroidales bacterium]